MAPNLERVRRRLREFDFSGLLVEDLGWNHYRREPVRVEVGAEVYALSPVAEKCGFVIFQCGPNHDGEVPSYPIRRKVESRVAALAYEHAIVFVDGKGTIQVWQWVSREAGRRAAFREHSFRAGQTGEALVQKLCGLTFALKEEESLSISIVADRVRKSLDVERVTKRFYERFKSEHAHFLNFIEGLSRASDRAWYTSLMLNRMMFVYFIQKKGFLDGDLDYLRNRLRRVQAEAGRNKFHQFYRVFLLRLFHEGLSIPEGDRAPDLVALLGRVPYLNGGLFDVHALEQQAESITIPDAAFEAVFDFFDAYTWHLDERPARADDEINPDVLGYIFEKYINQKEMGAYYTKEDITGYICRNAIVPVLFDFARQECPIAFADDGGVWRLLKDDPDRYIPLPMLHGLDRKLPAEIEAGVADPEQRADWNRLATADFGLPAETWREHVARRRRIGEIRKKLRQGLVRSMDELIAMNLDVLKFGRDVVAQSEGPELVKAFWKAIERLAVLDPTCGSGAFLFAALMTLEPLYEACLEGMQGFLDDLERSKRDGHPERLKGFRETLKEVEAHPNREYFILKSIVVRNLYGVDIMEEAVEICKLRLFLKLVAQVETVEQIEPLPDIDFNIRPGNTLVGYATLEEVKKSVEGTLGFENEAVARIEAQAEEAAGTFREFQELQTKRGVKAKELGRLKAKTRKVLHELREQLDRHLGSELGIDTRKANALEAWRQAHKPFHWFVEFHRLMVKGGFTVIIGNPPYLELREIDYQPGAFASRETNAVHAMCVERSLQLLDARGRVSMIVPLALVSTQRMQSVQRMLEKGRSCWYANFAWRPGKLFDTVNRALTIFVAGPSSAPVTLTSEYKKWYAEHRDYLMPSLAFVACDRNRKEFWVPKLGHPVEAGILAKCLEHGRPLGGAMGNSPHRVYYRTDGGLYWKVFTDFAPAFKLKGKAGHSTRETWFSLKDEGTVYPVIAALSSNLFWWWYTVTSNCRHLNPYDVQNFPVPAAALKDKRLAKLGKKYLEDLKKNSTMLVRNQKQTGRTETQSFKIQKSKPIIDEIDAALAPHYALSANELDFITNYDLRFRMGADEEEE
jgi:hypothetical protein